MSNTQKLDLYAAASLKAANGKDKFKIVMPTNIVVVRADEEPEQLAMAAGEDVIIDLAKINKNIEKRKEK